MREKIKTWVDGALAGIAKELNCPIRDDFVYDIEVPADGAFGDYSINLAFKLSRTARKSPMQIAETSGQILLKVREENPVFKSVVQSIDIAGPGFINFTLTDKFRAKVIELIRSENERYGRCDMGHGAKVLIEFVSANPTGPLTIAHGRQAAVGDVLANVFCAAGYEVTKEFYLNDAGRQVMLLGQSLWVRYQALFDRRTKIPEGGYHGRYLIDLAEELKRIRQDTLLHEPEAAAVKICRQFAVDSMLGKIKHDLKSIGVVFDSYFSETPLHEKGVVKSALDDLQAKGHLYRKEGALWFRSRDFGDDKDRVLMKQTGELTYLAADVAYHALKFRRGFKRLINLWGPDHHGYVARLKAACQALGYAPDQVQILLVQLTTLYRAGKPLRMSTRAGEFVTLQELVEEAGADAARYFFLMRRVESLLDFDLDLAKRASDDNPVYYVQYAHARISSVLTFAGRPVPDEGDTACLNTKEEKALLGQLAEFPEILKQAVRSLEPYRVIEYLHELAATFHQFYANCRVVSDDAVLSDARLMLTDAARIVIRNGLRILGVSQPVKM